MDKNTTTDLIQEEFKKLPPHVQRAITSVNWTQTLASLGKQYNLHIDQIGALQTETLLILFGLANPDEYGDSLNKELKLPINKLDELVTSINQAVFRPIRNQIIIEEERDGEEAKVESHEELLRAVEVPPKTVNKLIQGKLGGTMETQSVSTDHSIKKAPVNISHDPYHEPIE